MEETHQIDESITQAIEARIDVVLERLLQPVVEAAKRKLERLQREWLSVKDVMALTGLSAKKITGAIKAGVLLCSNVSSDKKRTYRIARTDIAHWMERCRLKQGPTKSARQGLVDEYFSKKGKRQPAA